jgi:predicted phosphodiesterase
VKYGLFADIHSNLEALEAVLEDMQSQGVAQMVCVGDIVGYNADPEECLHMVRALGGPIVKGNHDEEASEDRDISHFNQLALESMMFCRKKLKDEDKEFLRELPLQITVDNFTVVHATLDVPACWNYVFRIPDAVSSFTYQRSQLCFFGHTHIPQVFIHDGEQVQEFLYRKIQLQDDKRYMINVGSVGQPRDGDWRAAYVIYDNEEKLVELRRIQYDVVKAQQKVMKAGLPPRLAERLANAV